jgi:hypothetical protein
MVQSFSFLKSFDNIYYADELASSQRSHVTYTRCLILREKEGDSKHNRDRKQIDGCQWLGVGKGGSDCNKCRVSFFWRWECSGTIWW